MPDPQGNAPSFRQDAWTVGGDVINAERLKLALGGNAQVVVHAAKVEMPSRFSSPRRTQQEELIQRHRLFGGRDDELARLDELVNHSPNQFHFVHAASGFGKTALLANWVVRLRERQTPVCWQFINRFDGMADEEFTLRNTCEQLVALHGIVDEVSGSIADLRNSYVSLLKIPYPDGRLIVVLDGLDEAKGWTPGPPLFPRTIPSQTHVVFSARAETDDEVANWLTHIGLDQDQVDILRLNPLAEPAVAMLLKAAGGKARPLAEKIEFVRSLTDVSRGDPFYLHFLVQDITVGDVTPETIAQQPRKLKNYLDLWKKQLFEDVNVAEKEVYAILGLLCVALGPLKPVELHGASPALKDSLLLERELTGPMRRYLSGSRDSGYALGHPRFRNYLAQNVFSEADLTEFRRQLLEYCRGWRRHHSEYALNHLAAHLADLDLRRELSELVSKEWKVARAAQTGSPLGLVSDLELVIREELTSAVPGSIPFVRCALAYSTVVTIVERIPDEVFGVLTRLGHHRAAMDYASLLRSPERKAGAYGVIAAAFERGGRPEEATSALALSLSSAQRVSDPSIRVSVVLRRAALLHRLGAPRLVERAAEILETAAMDLSKASELEEVAGFFAAIARLDLADEMRERAKAAREAAGSGFTLDFSWMSTLAAPATETETADSLLAQSRIDDAMAVLLAEKDTLESAPPTPSHYSYWLRLAHGFSRAGDQERAHDAAGRAYESALALEGTYLHSRLPVLIEVTNSVRAIGFTDVARRSGQSALQEIGVNNLSDLRTIADIPDLLIDMGFASDAQAGVDRLVQAIETAVAHNMEASSIAALASAAGLASRTDDARQALALNATAGDWRHGPQSSWFHHMLARVLTRSQDEIAALRSSLENREIWQFAARASFSRALAVTGQKEAAVEVAEQALANPAPLFASEEMLECAHALVACGERRRALEVIENLRSSTDKFGHIVKKELLSELIVLLAELESPDAAEQCKRVLDASVRYVLPSNYLVRYCELLVALDERPKAVDVARSLVAAVSTKDPGDWDFGRALAEVSRVACSVADDVSLRKLKDLMLRPLEKATELRCRAALASAFAQRRSMSEARSLLAPALEALLSFGPDEYNAHDYVGPVADGLAHLKDVDSLRRLCDWALSASKYYQPPRLEALIPALATVGDRATIEAALATSLWDRWSQRARVLAVGSAAFMQLGDAEAAAITARQAVDAFLQERDGAVTPDVLPHLIPVVVAAGYKEGLVQISQMSAEKWPYRREYAPGVRLLLPALAALGLDDVQPRPYQVFLSETSFVDDAKIDLADVYARRGLIERAIAAADEAKSPAARARAHVAIARVMADAGDTSRAKERILAALSRFPAIRSDVVLVAEMALLATRIGANPTVCWTLKQAFVRATDIDVVSIDVDTYRNVARAAARIGGDGALKRVIAIASVARSPATRAAAGAAIMLALAEAGHHDDSTRLKDAVYRDVQDVGDVAQRASALLDMAQASARSGRSEDARGLLAQALDCARHSGRQRFLEVLSTAAAIVVSDASAVDVGQAIVDVDAFWS